MHAVVDFIVPNPLVSRGKPVLTSDAAANPAWAATQVGVGPSHVLLRWAAPGAGHADMAHAPSEYHVESSADSTDGADGTWRREVSVTDNAVCTRAHRFEFDGQSWVRLVTARGAGAEHVVRIRTLDVHDASDGTDDTWFFLGDGSASGFERGAPSAAPDFAAHIHAEYPGYAPATIDGSVAGELAPETVARLGGILAANPDFRHFALGYAVSERLAAAQLRASLQAIVQQLQAAGRVPLLARAATAGSAAARAAEHNRVIDELTREHRLVPGPDLDAWFQAHPEQLLEDGNPSAEGRSAIHRLWAEAADLFYAPQ